MTMTTTALIITTLVIVLGIYDLIVVFATGVGSSVSRTMQRAGLRSPVVAFVIGFICGHIFGYMEPEQVTVEPAVQIEKAEK